jgi:beta-1,2-mannobiose phosphorylase / 1,2-beta-oligomannan phosphorylase
VRSKLKSSSAQVCGFSFRFSPRRFPQVIRYRSTEPVLTPVLPQERHGIIANVVFSTGIDRRDDLGSPNRFDVYYGMADYRIGVARLDLPDFVPSVGVADASEEV